MLPALEFLMSKQPRGKVRVGTGNTVGVRSSDIFDEVEKFLTKYARHRASTNYSQVILVYFLFFKTYMFLHSNGQ